MMKSVYLLTLALLLPVQAMAVEKDSVYTWGTWAEGIKPAAGPVVKVTPPPAQTPDVNFRANETSAFLREAVAVIRVPAPPVVPSAPQVSGVTITSVDTPTGSSTSLNTGGALSFKRAK